MVTGWERRLGSEWRTKYWTEQRTGKYLNLDDKNTLKENDFNVIEKKIWKSLRKEFDKEIDNLSKEKFQIN